MKSFIYILIGVCFIPHVSGLMCYWCSGVGNDRDCERKPLGIKSGPSNVNCSSKFCTTAKVMNLDNGQVKSFARFCDNVYRGNRCVQDAKFMTCYQACVYDHCNNGNPSPKYLRVENLLSPDPDSNKKLLAEVSTDSEFHFFTAPPEKQIHGQEPPNAFKEQSIFKAFTTAQPLTTTPNPTTEAITTTTTVTSTTVQPETSPPTSQSDVTHLTSTMDTTTMEADLTTFVSTTVDPSTEPTSMSEGPPIEIIGSQNSIDDLGSEVPVDGPGLVPHDGPMETLSPESVKEDLQPDPDSPSDVFDAVIYTTPKPSPSTTETQKIVSSTIETNNSKSEELNLAATQNVTETSSGQSMCSLVFTLTLTPLIMAVLVC